MHDRYGLDLTTASPAACDAYVDGVDRVLGAMPDELAPLERAIAEDPGFALAHIALARAHFIRMALPAARASVQRARALADGASERERSHVHALALAMEGRPVDALAATRDHLQRWPRDAMVAAPATGVFGLFGFSGRPQREAEQLAFLDALAPHYDKDWWFDLSHAFAACEAGQLDRAWMLIERSNAAEPRSGHGIHVRVHVLYEQHEHARGLETLQHWLPGYAREGLMHCHLSWHLALFALAQGDAARAWQVYRDSVHPGASWGPPLNVATDAASFLWRAELAGAPRDAALWRELREFAQRFFPQAGVSFADVHVALACIGSGDEAGLQRLADELNERLQAHRLPAGAVVPRLVQGLAAYGRRDWNGAIEALEAAGPETVRIGGSRAQRDLVSRTLFAAYLQADRPGDARRLAR